MNYGSTLFKKKLGFASLIILASLAYSQKGFAMEPEGGEEEGSFSEDSINVEMTLKRQLEMGGEGQPPAKKPRTETTYHTAPVPQTPDALSVLANVAVQQIPLTLEDVNALIVQAKENNVDAQNKLIDLFYKGVYRAYLTPEKLGFLDWKTQNPDEPIQARCAHNDPYAAFVIFHFKKIGKSFPDLFSQVHERALQKNPRAQGNLGCMYLDGRGVIQDKKKGVQLIQLAVDQGLAPAQNNLGVMYRTGRHGVKKDEKEAFRLLKLAADQGLALAQNELGVMYHTGVPGVIEKDEKEALRLFKLAADQGYGPAQKSLGNMYRIGWLGINKDEKEAFRLFKLAVDQGYGPAQYNLGTMYRTGVPGVVEKNLATALYYYIMSKDPRTKTLLNTHLYVSPFVEDKNESFQGKIFEIVKGKNLNGERDLQTGLSFLLKRHDQKIAEEKDQEFKIPEIIQAYQKVFQIEKEAEALLFDLKSINPGFMVEGLAFTHELWKDSARQTTPGLLECDVLDGIAYVTFGKKNIECHRKFYNFLSQIDEKFTQADQALNRISVKYYQPEIEMSQKELFHKRNDPQAREECLKLNEKIEKLLKPITEIEEERTELVRIKNEFKILIRFTARDRQDQFCEEYPLVPKKG